jgi:hypothetical protein
VFAKARRQLTDPIPSPVIADILPASGYQLEARQLIAGCTHAWVFGGMGSWNNLGFSDKALQVEYNRLSDDLYDCVKLASAAATNSFG